MQITKTTQRERDDLRTYLLTHTKLQTVDMATKSNETETETAAPASTSVVLASIDISRIEEVRRDDQGLLRVYDIIRFVKGIKRKNSNSIAMEWTRLRREFPRLTSQCCKSKSIKGCRQVQWVCDLKTALEIVWLCKGKRAAAFRRQCAAKLVQFFQGDPAILEEWKRNHERATGNQIDMNVTSTTPAAAAALASNATRASNATAMSPDCRTPADFTRLEVENRFQDKTLIVVDKRMGIADKRMSIMERNLKTTKMKIEERNMKMADLNKRIVLAPNEQVRKRLERQLGDVIGGGSGDTIAACTTASTPPTSDLPIENTRAAHLASVLLPALRAEGMTGDNENAYVDRALRDDGERSAFGRVVKTMYRKKYGSEPEKRKAIGGTYSYAVYDANEPGIKDIIRKAILQCSNLWGRRQQTTGNANITQFFNATR